MASQRLWCSSNTQNSKHKELALLHLHDMNLLCQAGNFACSTVVT